MIAQAWISLPSNLKVKSILVKQKKNVPEQKEDKTLESTERELPLIQGI